MTVRALIQIADFQMSAIPSDTGTSRLIYVVAIYPWLRADKVSSSTVSNGPRLCMFIFQTSTSSRGQYKCSRILQVATRRQVCSGTKFGIESFWMRMHNSHRAAEIHARSMSKNELTQIVLQGSQTDRPGVTPISNHARQGTLSASSVFRLSSHRLIGSRTCS